MSAVDVAGWVLLAAVAWLGAFWAKRGGGPWFHN